MPLLFSIAQAQFKASLTEQSSVLQATTSTVCDKAGARVSRQGVPDVLGLSAACRRVASTKRCDQHLVLSQYLFSRRALSVSHGGGLTCFYCACEGPFGLSSLLIIYWLASNNL